MRENLRKARMKAGLTQADVARLAGLGLRQYKAIEYGESNGSVDVWKRLRSIFRKPIDYLLEQEEDFQSISSWIVASTDEIVD